MNFYWHTATPICLHIVLWLLLLYMTIAELNLITFIQNIYFFHLLNFLKLRGFLFSH